MTDGSPRPRRILVVDDEEPMAELLRRMLGRLGYAVTTRRSGPEALALYAEGAAPFDLVIVDYVMPGMNGDELAAAIREHHGEVPLVLCSGYCKQLSPEEIEELGFCAFVPKPVDRALLARVVEEALRSPRPGAR